DTTQLASLFTRDLEQAATLVAQKVELNVQLPPGVALKEALGYRATQEGQRVRIPLPDFASHQAERVVVALSVEAPAVGTRVSVASVELAYEDLLKKSPAIARAELQAEVTDRIAEVTHQQDKEVAIAAARAQSAQNIVQATDALRAGKKDVARELLSRNRPL